MERIVSPKEPFSFLEQRLHYAERFPERHWLNLVENVPHWPSPLDSTDLVSKRENSVVYQNCTGNSRLKKVISSRERSCYNLKVAEENILVTNGALHALALVFRSLARDAYATGTPKVVLCQAPLLTSIAKMLESCGYQIQYFSYTTKYSNFRERFRALADEITAVLVNSPNNPTGEVMSDAMYAEIVDTCNAHNVNLVVDLVYDSFVFDGIVHSSPLGLNDDWQNIYTVNSCSKNYGMPGLRVGWIISSVGNIKTLGGVMESECVCVSGVTQELALRAMEQGNEALCTSVNQRRGVLLENLRAANEFDFIAPQGGTQVLVKLPVEDVEEFADYMMVAHSLILATAQNFSGLNGAYIRLPIGLPEELTGGAIARLIEGLGEYQRLIGNKSPIRVSPTAAQSCKPILLI